jgi:hypothetical protein
VNSASTRPSRWIGLRIVCTRAYQSGRSASAIRSRLAVRRSFSTDLAGFQVPSPPSSFLFSVFQQALTWAMTRFASGAPRSLFGLVPSRGLAPALMRSWILMSSVPRSAAHSAPDSQVPDLLGLTMVQDG